MVQLRFIGCGDAFGSGGRFNTCFQVRHAQGNCLIDCGASSLVALRRFEVDPNAIDSIFLTHLHGDHFGGVPFFLLDARLASRRAAPLLIAGPPGTEKRVADTLECLFPGSGGKPYKFALEFAELAAGETFRRGPYAVTPFPADHSAGAPCYALRLEVEGRTIAYTGDGAWSDGVAAAGRDADLFIAETYFYERAITQHLDFKTLAAHLPEIAPRRLVLTHMSPDMLARVGALPFEAAEDGKTIAL